MPITITNMKPLEVPDPSSVEAERDKDEALARAQLQKDFPTLRFGVPPPLPSSGETPAAAEPPASDLGVFTIRKAQPEQVEPAPVEEDKGFFPSLFKTVGAKAKQYAADVPLMYHEERQFNSELEAARATVLPDAVAKARAEGKNILDVPEVRQAAQQLGIRPDMFVRGVEKYVTKSKEELAKIAQEANQTAQEQKAKAEPLLKRSKDLTAEIVAARPNYEKWSAQGIAFDALSSTPELAATLITGIAHPAAGVSTMFGLMMPRYYSEARQEGMSRADAQTYGILMAAGEAIPETAVIGRMTSVSIRKAIKDGMFKTAAKETVGTGISEGISEMVTEVYQKGVEAGIYGKETTLREVIEDVAYAGVVGTTMGAPFGTISGVAAGRRRGAAGEAPPPTQPPRQDTTGQPPPGPAPATTGTPPGPPPPTTGQPPTAPSGPAGLAAGRPAIYKPVPNAPGVAVMVNEVDPATKTAKVVRLDEETGDPLTDDEGNEQEFVANFDEFPELAAAPAAPAATPSPVAPAVPQGGPPPSQVPPAATTTEPTSDVAGQIKDMWNAKTKRRGVYLSPPTVAKMKEEGTYAAALKAGTVEENFDGQGGTLIVKSKKDMEEARAARDGGQTDMQAIVGTLTGAGVAKPDVPNAAAVVRKDETGATVQGTVVPPAAVQQTVQEMEQQPGTVEVTTPEAVVEERAQKVELEGAPERFALNTPDRTLTDAAGAVTFVEKQLDTPAEGKLTKPDVRGVAGTIGAAGAALRAATAAAKARGAPDALITAANKAVAGVEKFENKTEKDFFKARGVSESILRERTQALADALQGLVDWHNANPNATAQAPAPKPAKPKAPKAEKAKAVSKAKEAPAREERRKAENAALRERVERMTPEERVAAIMTDQRTGLPNKRAMEELRKANPNLIWTKVDADSLKWVNENMSEKSGDELLKAIAEELQAESDITPHHTGGDEFYVAGESAEGNEAAIQRANARLKGRTIRHGRTEIMPQMTWGKGFTDVEKADASMVAAKVAREMKGKRAARGEKPGSVRDVQQERMNLPEPTAEAANVGMVPKEFREPGKFFFHQVRNVADIPGIMAEGLRAGSNVSMIDGQAISEWDGGVVLVFENDGSLKAKGYQPDSLTTKAVKPVAILVDTTYAETPKVVADEALDALEKESEQLEADKAAMAETLGLDADGLLSLMVSYPKGDTYQAMKEKLADRPAVLEKLRKLITRDNVFGEKLAVSDKIVDKPAVTTADVLAKYQKHGVPVFSQTGISLMPTKVSATGVYVAPAGETKVGRKKKKYVPPKKREQTVYVAEEKAAEEVQKTVAAPDTIEMAPANVRAADLPGLAAEIIGVAPRELAAEIENDNTKQLGRVLTGLIEAVADRGGWPGWFVATMRGDILGDRKNELKGLIRQFIGASDAEMPAIREQILGLMTNLDGRTMPMQAIQSVFEAGQVGRAYNTIREALLNEVDPETGMRIDSDLNTLAEATEQSAFDKTAMSKERPGGPELSTVAAGELGTTAKTKESAAPDFVDEMFTRVTNNKFHKVSKALTSALKLDGRFQQMIDEVANGTATYSIRDFARVIREVAALHNDANVGEFGKLFSRIVDNAPDIPVEWTHPRDQVFDPTGRLDRNPAPGYFYYQGMLQINAPRSREGATVSLSQRTLKTFFHEVIHAATSYELERNPNGPFAKRLEAIRVSLVKQAGEVLGKAKVAEAIIWMNGPRTTPAPELVRRFASGIYGLSTIHELTAETLSNPMFHEFLRALKGPRWLRWARLNIARPLSLAWSRLFGSMPGSKADILLNELTDLTLRTSQAQYNRAQRYRRQLNAVRRAMSKDLGLNINKSREFIEKIMTVVSDADAEMLGEENLALGAGFASIVLGPRGEQIMPTKFERAADVERATSDRNLLSAYSTNAAQRMRMIDTWRQDPRAYPASWIDASRPNRALDPYDAQIDRMVGGRLGQVIRSLRYFPQTATYAKIKDTVKGFQSMDYLIRRNAKYFGSESDATNPLTVWKRIRDTRRSFSNQLLELAERMVNSKWMKLSLDRSEVVGGLMQQSSLWQIDPSRGIEQPKLFKFTSKRGWEQKVAELNAIWQTLTPLEKDIYHSTQKYFKQEYSRVRRAAIDMAFDMYGQNLPAAARTALYGVRKADQIDALVGPGKAVDAGTLDANAKFADTLKELIKLSTIEGPYFPLFREGDYVVEADREGILGDGTEDGVIRYANKEDANAAAADVRSGSPRNTAKVVPDGDGFIVKYKVYEISFHKSRLEADRALTDMRQRGIMPKGDVATRKISDVVAGSMTEGMKALVGHAQRMAGKTEDGAALSQMLEASFVRLLAEKAASYSQQINRKGYAGMKGREAHRTFAKRVRSSSWHYANLKTSLDQAKTLNRLRTASRATDIPVPSNMTQQEVVLQRGDVLAEITRRLRVEAEELDRVAENSLGNQTIGQLGFVNFLATPSFGFVNMMQTFNVALPFIAGKFGAKGVKALTRAMGVVTGPTFTKVMRGLVTKPGHVTSYDVYRAIEAAIAEHPRYAKFATGENSAIKQLVDRGTLTASFVQELQAIANNQNLRVSQGVEYLGLIPQGAEQWNRLTAALAILDVTNGNVDKAADVVDQVHFNYQLENRPRFFRKIGDYRMPQAITMFKMYMIGMYQLLGSLIVDSIRRSNTRQDRMRSAMALAGIIAAHTMSAGIMRGLLMEPLRALIYLWGKAFGDDDEFNDLDTMVQLWAADVAGSELGARILSTGVWNAVGFDMSTRMGLDKMAMFRELEGSTEDDFWKYFGQLLGPVPSMIIQKTATSIDLWDRGKHFEAIYNAIPVRLLQDARKAWNLAFRGVETKAGVPIVPADQFNWIDVVGTAAGFRTTEAAKASDLASTEFTYKGWKKARAKVLIGAYTRAVRDGDAAAKAEALAAIREFNEKNPHDPITGRSVKASFSGQERAAETRRGEGRNQALNELMQY